MAGATTPVSQAMAGHKIWVSNCGFRIIWPDYEWIDWMTWLMNMSFPQPWYVTGSGKIQHFCIFHQNWDFAIFCIYNVWITSVLRMSIYNCTVSELLSSIMQPLILPILRVVNLHVLILKNRTLFKMLDFRRSAITYSAMVPYSAYILRV